MLTLKISYSEYGTLTLYMTLCRSIIDYYCLVLLTGCC